MNLPKVDLSFLLTIFTTSIVIWYFLYQKIVDITTMHPATLSLIYLGLVHFICFLCLLFSFLLLIGHCLTIVLSQPELEKLKRFGSILSFSNAALFTLWGPMFIFSLAALFFQNIFENSKYKFFSGIGGFLIPILLCIFIFDFLLEINFTKSILNLGWGFYALSPVYFFIYLIIVSTYSVDVKFHSEKEFYQDDEILRFQILRKGYIFLPYLIRITYNFQEGVKSGSDNSYYLNLKEYSGNRCVIGIEFKAQTFNSKQEKYFYINKTAK